MAKPEFKSIFTSLKEKFFGKVEKRTDLPVLSSEESSFPFPTELIKDKNKREEFISDYKKLIKRCGHNSLMTTFLMYLDEQRIEKINLIAPDTREKQKIINFENTSEIIARFVEKGWADMYLSPTSVTKNTPLIIRMGGYGAMIISQSDGGGDGVKEPIAMAFIKNPSNDILEFGRQQFEERKALSTYIPPEKIRETFAKIDQKYSIQTN